MKINPLFVLREIADKYIVIPLGEEADTIQGVLSLNYQGAFLWKMMETDRTEEDLVTGIINKFDVEKNVAQKDVANYLDELKKIGCIL